MSDRSKNKAANSAPTEARPAETHADDIAALWELAALPPASRSAMPPGPLTQANVAERLARWDELPPDELIQLHRDPQLGGQLGLLQRADDWLLSGGHPEDPCPSAEALFEYADGPGATSLAQEAARQVEAHLERCPACAGLVHSLADLPSEALLAGNPPAPKLRLLRGGSLVAAAAVLVLAFGPSLFQALSAAPASAWPSAQVLRGPEQGPLLSPGGSLLSAQLGASWSGQPVFELRDVQRASAYRVRVMRNTGGAFDLGQPMLELHSQSARLPSKTNFAPGHYTWEAWATVDGRETLLGTRDFNVRADAEASAIAANARAADGGARVRLLEEASLFVDARLAAEALPASAERDAYLARIER